MSQFDSKQQQQVGNNVGTNVVARGDSTAEEVKRREEVTKRLANSSSEVINRISQYYHGGDNGKHYNLERAKKLRKDDNSSLSMGKLNPHQHRSLLKRKRFSDKRIKTDIRRKETKRLDAAIAATDAEIFLHTEKSGFVEVENDMERTFKVTQNNLKDHLDDQIAKNIYDLELVYHSPYGIEYDRSGRRGILYGKRGGHIALMDMFNIGLKTEFHLDERVSDVTFLHNSSMFAVAQEKNGFIYDDSGVEIHRLAEHQEVYQMQFLPHHWLLTTIGRSGYLKYQDTSTGQLVSSHRTKLGACEVMTQSKYNAVIHCGHLNGTVTLWSPACPDYLVKMLCHKGAPVQSMAIEKSGRYMVTGGADCKVRIWDLRMYKETHNYFTPGGMPSSLDVSQRGVLAVGHGSRTTFWSSESLKYKVKSPYMGHPLRGNGPVESLRFRPFEDICCIGHAKGISSIVIPGCGEPNLDSMEYNLNPYQDKKQRQEAEVRSLLDKLNPNTISLDPGMIGTVEEGDHYTRLERHAQLEEEANERKSKLKKVQKIEKKRMKGRNSTNKKLLRKRKNIIDENLIKLKEEIERQKNLRAQAVTKEKKEIEVSSALQRFF